MRSVLSEDGVPMSSAPSGPTEATTLPLLVANTRTFGVTSVKPAVSCALAVETNINPSANPTCMATQSRPPLRRLLMALPSPPHPQGLTPASLTLFQQSIHFDFPPRPEIHAPIRDDRDHEPCGHRGAIALAVLLRSVDRQLDMVAIERIKHRGPLGAVPSLGCDGPNDGVFAPVGRNRRRGAGVLEFDARPCFQREVSVLDRVITQIIIARRKEDVPVPVRHRAVSAPGHVNPLDHRISLCLELSHPVAVNHINHL